MSMTPSLTNRVRDRRLARAWSQAELAQRAGISRAAVSAIESERLVPSVAAALGLAKALECTVEELFGTAAESARSADPAWAWPLGRETVDAPTRFWAAAVGGHRRLYPVEPLPLGELVHDGVAAARPAFDDQLAARTLVMASCDPAVGLLARLYEAESGYRLLAFPRSSRQALQLLHEGVIHIAGVHLSTANDDGNADAARAILGGSARLIRVASWEDGIAVGRGVRASTIRGVLRDHLTWIGREAGSGARQCLDELLDRRPAPRREARDHRGVAEAIRCGWAEAGVCLKLVAEEAGLRFLSVRTEHYDLCYTPSTEHDPRITALVRVLQSNRYRRLLGELPGYDAAGTGQTTTSGASAE